MNRQTAAQSTQRMPVSPPQSSKIPLHWLLIIPFVLYVTGLVGAIGWLSFHNGKEAIDDITVQLRNEVSDLALQHVTNHMAAPQQIIADTAAHEELGLFDLRDAGRLERYLWHQVKQHDGLFITAVGHETGEVLGVGIEADGQMVIRAIDPGQTRLHTYAAQASGNRGALIRVEDFDPKGRPWYRVAVERGGPAWTDVYPNHGQPVLIISAVRPLYDAETQQLTGVTNATFSLVQLSEFLSTLEIGRTGQAFIMERSGDLIASSTDEPLQLTFEDQGTEVRTRLNASESKNRRVRETAVQLVQRFGSLDNIRQAVQLDLVLNGQKELVQVTPFSDGLGLDWLLVVVVPESDFTALIRLGARNTVLLCLGAIAIAVVMGAVAAYRITRPIRQLSHATVQLAAGNLNQRGNPWHSVKEVSILAHTFNQMGHDLQATFTELRDSKARLSSIAASIPGAIIRYVAGADGAEHISYASPGCFGL